MLADCFLGLTVFLRKLLYGLLAEEVVVKEFSVSPGRSVLSDKLAAAVAAEVKLFTVASSAVFDNLNRAAMFALFLAMRKRIVSHMPECKLD